MQRRDIITTILLCLMSVAVLGTYSAAERGGWAGGGSKQPPVTKDQLRHRGASGVAYVYWSHGHYGK